MDRTLDTPVMVPQPDDNLPDTARVSPRLVLLSASAMWLLYFVLITLRSLLFDDHGDFGEMLWRRVVVTLAGIAATMLAWPLIARVDRQPLATRAIVALIVMLPAALLLALVNQRVFEPMEARQMAAEMARQAKTDSSTQATDVRVDGGSILTDGAAARADVQRAVAEARREAAEAVREANRGPVTAPIAPPLPSAVPAPPAPAQVAVPQSVPSPHPTPENGGTNFQLLTDIVLSRYFLLVAWAALYLALGNAEQARAAERRTGEYRRAAKAAELRSLRYQVNPHFLFNTLNSLSALVMVGRADEAERMIQSIARFYRHSLAADPTADLPLADEIALQRHYLDIEAVRFPERLIAEFDIPAGLESACVPGMILQPLVENSIKYAVSPSRHPVTVRISAREAGRLLVLTVADDGSGANNAADAATAGTGIGLANVRLRLEACFGQGAHLQCGPLPAGGYASILTLPLVRNAC